MINRRNFLRNGSAWALAALAAPGLLQSCQSKPSSQQNEEDSATSEAQNTYPIGIQLYSIKDVLEKDLKGNLQALADMGYKEIESYPGSQGHYYGMEPKEFADMLNGMGLTLISSHFGSGTRTGQADNWHQATMLSRLDELVEKAAQTGQKYLTCSWMDESLRKTPDDLKRTAELFNQVGETCQKAGLQFAYHNHNFEFQQVGDVLLYDFMLENTDAKLVQWEMDMFWVVAAGADPIAYLKKYPKRFPLGHVKDMDKNDKKKNAEIGTGSIPYAQILPIAKEAGMEHFIVEHETFTKPSIETVKIDYQNLAAIKF